VAQPVRHLGWTASVTWLPPHLDETEIVAAALRAGVGIEAVGPYRITNPGPGGLIFGYATVNEQAIAEGIEILAHAISWQPHQHGPT
jgi:GntR family transcriptional regulator/MocR family aminotransferase